MNRCDQCFYKKINKEREGWCYMFREFMIGCRQFVGDGAVTKNHIIGVLPTALEMIIAKHAKKSL